MGSFETAYPIFTERIQDFFRARLLASPDVDCILWNGKKDKNGYGLVKLSLGGRQYEWFAHRVSYRINKGEMSPTLQVRHTCDVPACINPDHLLLGTAKDNTNDMLERGGMGMTHLTEDQVREIHEMRGTYREIGKKYGVSASAVSLIKAGTTWKHLGLGAVQINQKNREKESVLEWLRKHLQKDTVWAEVMHIMESLAPDEDRMKVRLRLQEAALLRGQKQSEMFEALRKQWEEEQQSLFRK